MELLAGRKVMNVRAINCLGEKPTNGKRLALSQVSKDGGGRTGDVPSCASGGVGPQGMWKSNGGTITFASRRPRKQLDKEVQGRYFCGVQVGTASYKPQACQVRDAGR